MGEKVSPAVLPPFRAVILDMDGLVLDTEPAYCLAWRRAAADLGYALPEDFCRGLAGLHYQDVERALVAACGARLSLPRFREQASAHWRDHVRVHGIPAKPGLESLMATLQELGVDACLATNSRLSNCLECLDLAGVRSLFPRIVARDQVAQGKPAPDLFLAAAELLDAKPGHCLAVEDSDIGIEAAWRAGTIPIMVPGDRKTSAASRERAHGVLASLAELAAMIGEKVRHSADD